VIRRGRSGPLAQQQCAAEIHQAHSRGHGTQTDALKLGLREAEIKLSIAPDVFPWPAHLCTA
jgi:hypothetical protein